MKRNRIIWVFVVVLVSITIYVTLGTNNSFSQKETQKTQENKIYQDLSKYSVVDYDAPEPTDAREREERRLKSKRYDSQRYFVKRNVSPNIDGVVITDETPPPSVIPSAESNLIIIGEVINASAYLSNTKENIYSEYSIQVIEVVKEDASNKLTPFSYITADRTGGCVRYANGQKVLYKISGQDLPKVGSRYVFFLTSEKENPNYKILTGYELKENLVVPLDDAIDFKDFNGINSLRFIKAIRNKILQNSQLINK